MQHDKIKVVYRTPTVAEIYINGTKIDKVSSFKVTTSRDEVERVDLTIILPDVEIVHKEEE